MNRARRARRVGNVVVVRRIAIAWMLAGLGLMPSCIPIAQGVLQSGGGWGGGPSGPTTADLACQNTTGASRERCLAANPSTSEAARERQAANERESENAATRETGKQLERERQIAEAPEPSRCLGTLDTPASSDVIVDSRPESPLPESLDRGMIADALAQVNARVMWCHTRSPVQGRVVLSVEVAAVGCVIDVRVESSPDPELGSCIAAAVQNATFAKTIRSGSFRYPFVF